MKKNTVEPGRSQIAILLMRITCCMTKASHTLEHIILIAFSAAKVVTHRHLNVAL